MNIIDIKSLPDLINYYGANDKNGDGKLTSEEVSALTISKYDTSGDNILSPWEVMTAVNRIQARPVFKYRDILRLRQSKRSPFPLLLKLKTDTTIRGIKYKRGSVFINRFGKVQFGVLAAKTTIQGRSFPAGTKLFFYLNGNIKGAKSPVDTTFKLANQKITVKAGSLTRFYATECRIKSATTAKSISLKTANAKYIFGTGSRLSFFDYPSSSLDIWSTLNECLAMLRHKSADKQVKGLELIKYLAANAQFSHFIEMVSGHVWKDVAKLSKQIVKAGKPPSSKLLIALIETLRALAGGSATAETMLKKLIFFGLQKYPIKTLALFIHSDVYFGRKNYTYTSKVLLKNHDWQVRLAALNYFVAGRGLDAGLGLLIERFKVESNTKILAHIISLLTGFAHSKKIQKLYPRVKKLAKSASSDKALKKAAKQFIRAVDETIREDKALAEEERKERKTSAKEERERKERYFLQGRLSGGLAGGLMVRHDDAFGTAGMFLSVHGAMNKGIWLSKSRKYMLSTSIELGLDPLMLHWKQGWYSMNANSSLRINLSKFDVGRNENWRLSVGPGFAMSYTPAHDTKRVDYGPTISAGIFFERESRLNDQLWGPELRVTHFPRSKETIYMLSIKYMWQFKRRWQSQ